MQIPLQALRPILAVLDAWGKFPQGLLYGHFTDLGNYESCLSSSSQPVGSAPKYCLSHIQFKSLLLEAVGSEALTLNIGTCVPSSCSAAQLNRWLHSHLRSMFGESGNPAEKSEVLVQEQSCSVAQAAAMDGLDWFAV